MAGGVGTGRPVECGRTGFCVEGGGKGQGQASAVACCSASPSGVARRTVSGHGGQSQVDGMGTGNVGGSGPVRRVAVTRDALAENRNRSRYELGMTGTAGRADAAGKCCAMTKGAGVGLIAGGIMCCPRCWVSHLGIVAAGRFTAGRH